MQTKRKKTTHTLLVNQTTLQNASDDQFILLIQLYCDSLSTEKVIYDYLKKMFTPPRITSTVVFVLSNLCACARRIQVICHTRLDCASLSMVQKESTFYEAQNNPNQKKHRMNRIRKQKHHSKKDKQNIQHTLYLFETPTWGHCLSCICVFTYPNLSSYTLINKNIM